MVPEVDRFIPIGHINRPGRALTELRALVFHYTANDRPDMDDVANARWFARSFESGAYWSMSSHGIVKGYIEAKSIGHGAHELGTKWESGEFEPGYYWDGAQVIRGSVIKGSAGRGTAPPLGVPFAYGSAHIVIDQDSVSNVIPLTEIGWHVGDQRLPLDNGYNGRQRAAHQLLGDDPNKYTVGLEMCNNDTIKNSDADWKQTVSNAMMWAIQFLKKRNLTPWLEGSLDPQSFDKIPEGRILLLKHQDVTGKICPKPMIDDPQQWINFVKNICQPWTGEHAPLT